MLRLDTPSAREFINGEAAEAVDGIAEVGAVRVDMTKAFVPPEIGLCTVPYYGYGCIMYRCQQVRFSDTRTIYKF